MQIELLFFDRFTFSAMIALTFLERQSKFFWMFMGNLGLAFLTTLFASFKSILSFTLTYFLPADVQHQVIFEEFHKIYSHELFWHKQF